MRDHESTHNSPISTSDSQQSLFSSEGVSTKPAPEKDDTFNYQCALLEYGMVILHFFDAIREGEGKCIFRCWKFQLPYLRNDAGSTRYALEALRMMFQVYGWLSLNIHINFYGTELPC